MPLPPAPCAPGHHQDCKRPHAAVTGEHPCNMSGLASHAPTRIASGHAPRATLPPATVATRHARH
ncbi:hypothetical protein E2562_037005 [Oryza meyeriana var. granulata]|uniref:Uncharacterized protein n=1 Tax=Oryza meyeriana var. granulata TaxID=110450 RepID=A0A6G1CX52_9ORYZ|nr:hypothetical protein E2562_037005 [Oryza meyeriana var. granulata]